MYHNTSTKTSYLDSMLREVNHLEHSTELSPNLNYFNSENANSSKINTSDVKSCIPLLKDKSNIKQVWGHNLNTKKKGYKENQLNLEANSSFQLSQEMFKAFNFSKRNPRKLASHSKSDNSNTENSNKNLEEMNLHNRNVNESIKTDASEMAEWTTQNFKVISLKDTVTSKSSNTFQQLIQRSSNDSSAINSSLNKSWLNRCTNIDVDKKSTIKTEKLKEENDCTPYRSNDSDDDYLFNSDSEGHSNKRVRNCNKMFNDEYFQNLKKICCENNLSGISDVKNMEKYLYDSNKYNKLITDSCNSIKIRGESSITNIEENNRINEYSTLSDNEYIFENSSIVSMTKISDLNQIQFDKMNRIESDKVLDVKNTNTINCSDMFQQMPAKISVSNTLINNFSEIIKPANILTKNNFMIENKFVKNKSVKELNKNFLRINLKKKVFVRGKKSFNISTYKKTQWKKKKQKLELNDSNLDFIDFIDGNNELSCFKCRKTGHIAKQCKSSKDSGCLAIDNYKETPNISILQDIEYVTNLAGTTESKISTNNSLHINDMFNNHEVPGACKEGKVISTNQEISPLYSLNPDGSVKDAPPEVLAALAKFGHKQFRNGQEKSIMRILSGLPTLVTLATGSGKSLCYQLPAYLYAQRSKCITLVISPLISLMDDQISEMPDFLPAACFHTNQSPALHKRIMDDLKTGKITILLVSPEAIAAGDMSRNFVNIFHNLPIAFACIDEAHCISQWSYNFRPSYLMICTILRENLKVKNFLALTATASKYTISSIIDLLHIEDKTTGVISDKSLPLNLNLTISHDKKKEEALISILQSEKFVQYNSIIIYCTRREECSRIAGLLRISLKDENLKSNNLQCNKKKESAIAEAYHAGLSAHRRKAVYTAFMKSKTRIIVATVAFGMGINKSNIRSVIHYNMPSNFESYVQEIGRAGRDGLPAHCHLFLNAQDNSDKYELRRHINADGIDRHTIRRLLKIIFIPCNCVNLSKADTKLRCQGHEVAFSVEETVHNLDIKQETITTLLCYLELYFKCYVKLLPSTYINAKISSYVGSKDLILTAQSSPALAMVISLLMKQGIYHDSLSTIKFPVINIASSVGLDSGFLKNQLKRIEWKKVNDEWKRSAISVNFDTLGFRIKVSGDLTAQELDEVLDSLTQQCASQVIHRLTQLENTASTLQKYSYSSIKDCLNLSNETYTKSAELKDAIKTYFESDAVGLSYRYFQLITNKLKNEEQVINDIRDLILSYRDTNFTGRSVARIFHGIQSPNYPALIWSRSRFWRIHITEDFNTINQVAAKEILKMI